MKLGVPVLSLALFAGCGLGADPGEGAGADFPVAQPAVRTIHLEQEYVAEIRASRHAEVRARVAGLIEEVFVDEGQRVEKDQPLFSVNARALQQELAVARATLKGAQASARAAELEAVLSIFVTPESLAMGLAGGLVAPLINRGAIAAEFQAASATQLQALYTYQEVLVAGVLEVERGVGAVARSGSVVAHRRDQLQAAERTIDAADALFRAGRATWLDVLLAQQSALEAELELVDAELWRLRASVELYRALGGGASAQL